MASFNPHEVTRVRAWILWLTRASAVLCLIPGAYLVLKRIIFAVSQMSLTDAFGMYTGVGEEHSFSRGIALLIVGTILALSARRLSQWIISMPTLGCPRCGYEGFGPETERCPECGLLGSPGAGRGRGS